MTTTIHTMHGLLGSVPKEGTRTSLGIGRLINGTAWIPTETGVLELQTMLAAHPEVEAVAVLRENAVAGVVTRRNLASLLAKPFAREIFARRLVDEVMEDAKVFDSSANILTVAGEIGDALKESETRYFIATKGDGVYQGLFSSRDMLLFLSDLTQSEIDLARKVQAKLVRESEFLTGKTFELAAVSVPAKGVGGDYYKILNYADRRWIFAVCDVSGKGVSASIITALLWGMMSLYDFRNRLDTFLGRLNSWIYSTFESEKFVTGIFIDYDEERRVLSFSDLGHSHMLLFRKGSILGMGKAKRNLPLGIISDMEVSSNTIKVSEGDLVLIFTDGMIEQTDPSGAAYSLDRVIGLIRANLERPVETLKELLSRDFNAFKRHAHLNDDVTFLLIKFKEQDIIL